MEGAGGIARAYRVGSESAELCCIHYVGLPFGSLILRPIEIRLYNRRAHRAGPIHKVTLCTRGSILGVFLCSLVIRDSMQMYVPVNQDRLNISPNTELAPGSFLSQSRPWLILVVQTG